MEQSIKKNYRYVFILFLDKRAPRFKKWKNFVCLNHNWLSNQILFSCVTSTKYTLCNSRNEIEYGTYRWLSITPANPSSSGSLSPLVLQFWSWPSGSMLFRSTRHLLYLYLGISSTKVFLRTYVPNTNFSSEIRHLIVLKYLKLIVAPQRQVRKTRNTNAK